MSPVAMKSFHIEVFGEMPAKTIVKKKEPEELPCLSFPAF
jgi:hypothetical protein